MGKGRKAYKLPHAPIVLKDLVLDCDITQGELAEASGVSRSAINLCLNRGYLPERGAEAFKVAVVACLSEDPERTVLVTDWLIKRDLGLADIWQPAQGPDNRKKHPVGRWKRALETRHKAVIVTGNGEELSISAEVEMVAQEAMKHFHIFRNPFIDDVQKESDIFMSDEHRYIEMAMIDAAEHGGFLAVIGECGSGKSVIRRKVVQELRKDGTTRVIYPQIIDKGRLNASAICDAIIMDLSEQKPKQKLEQKTRQVHKLLLERSKENYRCVLMIEEAHDLSVNTLKYLKRFYELEDGYRKLLGIILIGQVELRDLLDEGIHIEMREVIRRIQVAEVKGLNGNLRDYLALKFRRVGAKLEDIFTDGGIEALGERLTKRDRQQRKLTYAYPLVVNNLAARAMNRAYEMGEEKVTEEVISKI